MSAAGDVVTQNNSGLVCAINNYPADGLDSCLNAKHGKFFYWSYWQGDPDTNTWTYASVGPASHDVGAGQDYVEGWRYQDPGPDNPTAPPPSVTPGGGVRTGVFGHDDNHDQRWQGRRARRWQAIGRIRSDHGTHDPTGDRCLVGHNATRR